MLVYQHRQRVLLGREQVDGGDDGAAAHGLRPVFWNSVRSLRGLAPYRVPVGPLPARSVAAEPCSTGTRRADANPRLTASKARALHPRARCTCGRRTSSSSSNRVRATDPSYRKAWLLHGVSEPRSRPRPRGRAWEAAGRATATRRSSRSRTARAACASTPSCPRAAGNRAVGGPGFEFWTPGDERGGAWARAELAARPAGRGPLPGDPYS